MLTANICYIDKNAPRLEKIAKGDWIDVRACSVEINGVKTEWNETILTESGETEFSISYKEKDVVRIYLGFAMQCPDGHEAHILPRGSTHKAFGLIQTNSKGIVDWSYRGPKDQWLVPMYATRDGKICKYDRFAQFRFVEKMGKVMFNEMDTFPDENRGSQGSTGYK